MGTFEFYQSIFKKVTLVGLNSLWQKKWQYSTWYFMILSTFFFYLKHQNKVKFFIELLNPSTLKTSVVIFTALDTFTASLTSAASATSMTSTTSKALFPQKLPDLDYCILPGTKMTNTDHFLWIGSSKIQIFTSILQSWCQRLLRPANITFLKKYW